MSPESVPTGDDASNAKVPRRCQPDVAPDSDSAIDANLESDFSEKDVSEKKADFRSKDGQKTSLLRQSFSAALSFVAAITAEKRPRWSSFFLLLCIGLAIFADERVVRILLPECHLRDYLYDATYVAKWEFFALSASLITTLIYWYYQIDYHREIQTAFLRGANLTLGLSVVMLVFAIKTIIPESRGSEIYALLHLGFVSVVAIGFLLNDVLTWRGMQVTQAQTQAELQDYRVSCWDGSGWKDDVPEVSKGRIHVLEDRKRSVCEHKAEFVYSLIAVDIPMCFAFFCLLAFVFVHPYEHDIFKLSHRWIAQHWGDVYFMHAPRRRATVIEMSASTEYFVGGAIAFQFLVSTVVYILISANVLRRASESR